MAGPFSYLDIETIPDQSEGALERAREGVSIPANYKNEETIEKYKDEKAQEAWEKTALDGFKGHVCCIVRDQTRYILRSVKEEKDLLERFFTGMKECVLVGHNIIGFDIQFLTRRALVLGVELPYEYIWPRALKPWDKSVFDTMTALGGKDWVSLDNLAKALRIRGKSGNGGAVNFMWQQGLHDEISDYCADDVRVVREIHKRFLACGW
jgi:DNA polymerase elongation subunit (family B)